MWFTYLLILMLSADLWWWYIATRSARRARLGAWAPITIGIFMGLTSLGLLLLVVARIFSFDFMVMPEMGVVYTFIWHFLLLPVVTFISVPARLIGLLWSLLTSACRRWRSSAGGAPVSSAPGSRALDTSALDTGAPADSLPNPSRRAFLAQIVVVGPPMAALALTGKAAIDQDQLALRKIDLPLRQLPRELDGLKIAHVTDPHVGSFMSDRKYKAIIDLANSLDADLVLHGGDLINHSLRDLPDGIQLLKQMRSRHGVFSCQGNHDKIDNPERFERDTARAGIGMLLDQSHTLRINGQKVQLIAPRWVSRDDRVIRWTVEQLLPQRDPDAFTILMAHHPHAFDAAADAKIPLTLSGHTHGGQFKLAGPIGVGSLMYRYVSGAYRKGDSATVVSVGTGNWFPLRINVPCEIIELTLRRM